jgi:hypothetical protein
MGEGLGKVTFVKESSDETPGGAGGSSEVTRLPLVYLSHMPSLPCDHFITK